MTNEKKEPFVKLRNHLMSQGMSLPEAGRSIQERYQQFFDSNLENIKRFDEKASSIAQAVTGQLITLATLIITVTGLFLSLGKGLDNNHKLLIVAIIVIELTAIIVGVIDYIRSMNFFSKWAIRYSVILDKLKEAIDDGSVQMSEDMNKITEKVLKDAPKTTGNKLIFLQLFLTVSGGFLLALTFLAVFFNLPGAW